MRSVGGDGWKERSRASSEKKKKKKNPCRRR
jgi:hypothetical protein